MCERESDQILSLYLHKGEERRSTLVHTVISGDTLPCNHTHTPQTFIHWPAGVETFRSSISTVIGRSRMLMWTLKGAGEREWEISLLQQCFFRSNAILRLLRYPEQRNKPHNTIALFKHVRPWKSKHTLTNKGFSVFLEHFHKSIERTINERPFKCLVVERTFFNTLWESSNNVLFGTFKQPIVPTGVVLYNQWVSATWWFHHNEVQVAFQEPCFFLFHHDGLSFQPPPDLLRPLQPLRNSWRNLFQEPQPEASAVIVNWK